MAHLHLLLGPVGSGKSSLSVRLAEKHSAVVFNVDAWMTRLYGGDERPADRMSWYRERVDRCFAQIWVVVEQLSAVGTPVVLELGLLRRVERKAFYERVDLLGAPLTVYVLDVSRDVRRERVMRRSVERGPTFTQEVPPDFFELASDLWQPPDEHERAERNIIDL